MKKSLFLSVVMAGVLSAGAVCAQEAPGSVSACPCPCGMMRGMGANKAAMMEWHQKMMEKVKASEAELDKLVAEMNAAPADKKADAVAAVVTKMVEQRKAWMAEAETHVKKMMEAMKEKAEPEKKKK